MPATRDHRPIWSLRGAFRRALIMTAGLILAATAAMGALVAVGLARSDALLDRLSRSQDQLAQVTHIQADMNRLRVGVATGAPDIDRQARQVDERLRAYLRSVLDEGARLGAGSARSQADEIANATRMIELFEVLRGELASADPATAEERRFEELAERAVAREREEARDATLAMGELRRTITRLAAAVAALVVLVVAAGAWIMLAANLSLEAVVGDRTAEIEASRLALAEIDRNRRLFFSKIGHELRTPATVIRGEAEVALRDAAAGPEQLREALRHIDVHSQFLQRRLEDLLALASAEDGRISLRRDPVLIGDVVRQAAAAAEPYVRASGLELRASIPPADPRSLTGDASWLLQAVLALLDNAAKFADGREPIRLDLAGDGARAKITVADSGPGVEPADLPRIFDTYYQASAGRARGGSGLGLSVARWVVEQHGGEIRAQSSPGKGLTVEIELPVRA